MINLTNNGQMRSWIQHRYFIAAALITFFLLVGLQTGSGPGRKAVEGYWGRAPSPRELTANSTLGFERIVALSPGISWRTRGLHAAATLSGLEFTTPTQPRNPEELIRAFEHIGADSGAKTPAHGSATAWFAHLDVLKFVIASGFSTTLIVEDDVDWDIEIKQQMQLISDNVRAFTHTADHDETPYGSGWDVLWIGHCGSAIEKDKLRTLPFADPTRCKTESYSGWSKHFLRDSLEEGYRLVQDTALTVCTFAYAVTAESAQKVLKLMARGANEAYDVSLSSACRSGHLRCVIVNPQVMNHYEPPPEHGYLSPVHQGDGQINPAEVADFESYKGTTGNIVNSARCKALFNDVCMRPPSEI